MPMDTEHATILLNYVCARAAPNRSCVGTLFQHAAATCQISV